MIEEEVHAATLHDPDAQPLTRESLASMPRAPGLPREGLPPWRAMPKG